MVIPNRCLASCVLYLEECERKMNSFKGGISYDPSNKAWVIVGFTLIIGLFQRGCVNMCVNMCVNVCVNMFVNICVNMYVIMCVRFLWQWAYLQEHQSHLKHFCGDLQRGQHMQ